jgi:hypothetical protein
MLCRLALRESSDEALALIKIAKGDRAKRSQFPRAFTPVSDGVGNRPAVYRGLGG